MNDSRVLSCWVLTFLTGTVASAVPIAVVNPSFEDPVLPDRGFTSGEAPGWAMSGGSSGVYNPDEQIQDAYDGSNVLWINGGLWGTQTLVATAQAGTYTLSVFVNHRIRADIGHRGPNDYDLELLVDGAPVAPTAKSRPVTNGIVFQFATATFEIASGSPRRDDCIVQTPESMILMANYAVQGRLCFLSLTNARIYPGTTALPLTSNPPAR
jgi:hypothetical protein